MTLILRSFFALSLILAVATNAQADVVIFKQGASNAFVSGPYTGTEDTWIHLNGPFSTENRNGGADGRIIVGGLTSGTQDERHQFIRFDLSSMAGQFTSITSVTLRLYWHEVPTSNMFGGNGIDTVQFFRVSTANADWVEGNSLTGTDTFIAGESTWNEKRRFQAGWAGGPGAPVGGADVPGVDYVNTLLASNTYNGTETVGGAFDLVFTDPSIITSWMGGPNAGIYGRTIGKDEQAIFRSSEFSGFEPELIIFYSAVPEPSSIVLLSLVAPAAGLMAWRRRRAEKRPEAIKTLCLSSS